MYDFKGRLVIPHLPIEMSAPPPGDNDGETKDETPAASLAAEPPVVIRGGTGSEKGDGGVGGTEGGGGISGGGGDEATAVATVDAADPNNATIHSGSLSNLETRGSGLLRHCVVEPFLLPPSFVSLAHTSRGARNLLEEVANAIVKETPGYADVHSQQLISR